jgi:hypothetical protein
MAAVPVCERRRVALRRTALFCSVLRRCSNVELILSPLCVVTSSLDDTARVWSMRVSCASIDALGGHFGSHTVAASPQGAPMGVVCGAALHKQRWRFAPDMRVRILQKKSEGVR